jgi:hypothetical protein
MLTDDKDGKITIFKLPKPAYKIHFNAPAETKAIITLILCCISFAGNLSRIFLTSCCFCGMICVVFTVFAKGMGSP